MIQEEKDLIDAMTYALSKNFKQLDCTLVNRSTFQKIREEQNESKLNKSAHYESFDSYRKETFE